MAKIMKCCLAVNKAKAEILADIKAGVVPAAVASYSELHDYVDANYYGGAFEAFYAGCTADDDFVRFWNRVQAEVDQWLKDGRPDAGCSPCAVVRG